jgi:hypothetical protein
MSQPIRHVVAVTGLAAALLLMVPAPSRAASRAMGLRGPVPAADLMTRAWSWLEGLLGASGPAASLHQTIQQKDGAVVIPVPPPATNPNNGQGSMIDPDGVRR